MLRNKKQKFVISVWLMGALLWGLVTSVYAAEPSALLKVTGDAIGEEVIFSDKDLDTLAQRNELNLGNHSSKSVDLLALVQLCRENTNTDHWYLHLFGKDHTQPVCTLLLDQLEQDKCRGTIFYDNHQIHLQIENKESQSSAERVVEFPLHKIIVSSSEQAKDPYYAHHDSSLYEKMKKYCLTVNFYSYREEQQSRPIKTVEFTVGSIEQMMKENPDQVKGNFYGTIGDQESKSSMGLGAFIDYFEGLDLGWLLKEKAGMPANAQGYAVFYGRDNQEYARIPTLEYFYPRNGDYSQYQIELSLTEAICDVVPIIAPCKNGYPILPEHDHECIEYVDYNKLNAKLKAIGMDTKIGLVKNHSGPFVAGLPNLQNVYGGYEQETAGDCVRIDLYGQKTKDHCNIINYITEQYLNVELPK